MFAVFSGLAGARRYAELLEQDAGEEEHDDVP
jgi:hypothetical protein